MIISLPFHLVGYVVGIPTIPANRLQIEVNVTLKMIVTKRAVMIQQIRNIVRTSV